MFTTFSGIASIGVFAAFFLQRLSCEKSFVTSLLKTSSLAADLRLLSVTSLLRSTLNSATQLAPNLRPLVEYEDRRWGGPAHIPVFESRCFLSSRIEGMNGIILMKEGKGSTIKAAREAAAYEVVKVLKSQPTITSREAALAPHNLGIAHDT